MATTLAPPRGSFSSGLLLSLVALVLLLSSTVSGRKIYARFTAVLDVSAALQRTSQPFSFSSHHSQLLHYLEQTKTTTAAAAGNGEVSRTISLELRSRDFLPSAAAAAARHADYKCLTADRLRRDAARVRGISARLALALHGVKRSDLYPLDANQFSQSTAEISGPIISGTSQGSGEYFSRVSVGQPPKPMFMVLDTGSDVTWVQCQPCADCYQQSDPIFDPSSSSSYSPLPCETSLCKALDVSACRNSSECLYQVSYGDGSYTVGDFATETLTFGRSQPVQNVALGCGHDNEGLFVGAAGLLGLGGGELSLPSQLEAKSFSYCLVDRDSPSSSTLEFGGSELVENSDVTAPLLRNGKMDTFYYVGMTGISVGGEMLSIPQSAFAVDDSSGGGGVIVDSGTAVTRLKTEAYSALRDEFKKGTTDLTAAEGVALFDTCYDLSGKTSVEVPTVGFHFAGGKELRLPAKNYLIPVDSSGTFCLAFAATSAELSIIGNVQQQGTRVAFDRDNGIVGFTANQC